MFGLVGCGLRIEQCAIGKYGNNEGNHGRNDYDGH